MTVTHKEALVLEEEHDVVYREEQSSGSGSDPTPAPDPSDITRVVDPSPVLLFRYSALTFNGHRIHYDADYCRQVEGYPGLVVHAPLAATLMLDLAAEYGEQSGESRAIRQFRQKSVSPLFSPDPFSIHLSEQQSNWEMWAANPDGNLASRATLVLD